MTSTKLPPNPKCQEHYYPEWSSRGMRAVDCLYRASWRMTGIPQSLGVTSMLLCGTHKSRYQRNFPERTYTRL